MKLSTVCLCLEISCLIIGVAELLLNRITMALLFLGLGVMWWSLAKIQENSELAEIVVKR